MSRVVISQPMLFPWVGLFEQIRAADVYVHYDDVQFSKGSFTNRVQIKTARGSRWLTVPVRVALGEAIGDVQVAGDDDWRARHLALLGEAFEGAPFAGDALALVRRVYGAAGAGAEGGQVRLGDLAIAGIEAVLAYFDLAQPVRVVRSSTLGIAGKSWPRVLDIVRALGGDVYITGHGARHYLDHEAFEAAGVQVEYLDYQKRPYPQLHGAFTPYVSILDLIANVGPSGRAWIASGTKPWREFLRAA